MREQIRPPQYLAEGEMRLPASPKKFGEYMVGKMTELPATVPLSASGLPRQRRFFKEQGGNTPPPTEDDPQPAHSIDELEIEMRQLLAEESVRYAGRVAVSEV